MLILLDELDPMPFRASIDQNVTERDRGPRSCNVAQFDCDFPNRPHRIRASDKTRAKRFQSRQFALSAHATIQLHPHRWRKRRPTFVQRVSHCFSLRYSSDRLRSTSIHADESIKTNTASLTVSPSPRPDPPLQSLRWCPSPSSKSRHEGFDLVAAIIFVHGGQNRFPFGLRASLTDAVRR